MDIYSIGDGAFLAEIITAVTLVSGSGEFATMAKIGLLFGVILLLFQGITSGGRGINLAQVGVAGLLYALMFGGTQTVTVTDAYTQEVRVIDNVPNGVAATGSFLSSIGFNITELFETGFSTPTMTEQGYGFSLDVLKRVRMHSLTEFHLGPANQGEEGSDFYESWSEYIKTCAIRGMELGLLSKDEIFRSPDFITALNFDNSFYRAELRTGSRPESLPCSEAYDRLDVFTRSFFLPSFKENVLPSVLGLQQPAGAADVEEVINDALNGLGVGPAPQPVPGSLVRQPITADDYIISSVLVPIYYYALRKQYSQDGKFSYADQIDDSVRARNSQWMANQSLFDRYLRPMLTFVEGFMFAVTPILALLIPVGAAGIGAAGRFLLIGAWIQLWMPALAVVNLFLHNVVAGKMAALADAGMPLTSLAGLHQGDDIIQTWLATGGLMASAVPVLTLMIVYGGAISANFFATRLQGEDVVMERQAAGPTFNPYPQLHMDPAVTHDRTAGARHLTSGAALLDNYNMNQSLSNSAQSEWNAHQSASERFENKLQQSVGETWSAQESATTGQGFSMRAAAEGSQIATASEQHFGDTARSLAANTDLSKQQASEVVTRAALNASLGTKIPLFGGSAGGDLSSGERQTLRAGQQEQYLTKIEDKVSDSAEVRASFVDAAAADISGNESNAYFSATNLGRDESLSQSAEDVISTGQSYSEAVRSSSSMAADQNINAKFMIPKIAASPQARKELYDLAHRENAIVEAGTYFDHMGKRDQQLFGGNEDHAKLYSLTHTLAGRLDDGDEGAARAQAGLADVFGTAHGSLVGEIGNPGANQGLADDMNGFGAVRTSVEQGQQAGPSGLDEFYQGKEAVQQNISDGMEQVPVIHDQASDAVDEATRLNSDKHNDRSLAVQRQRDAVLDKVPTPKLDAIRGIGNAVKDALEPGPDVPFPSDSP